MDAKINVQNGFVLSIFVTGTPQTLIGDFYMLK